MDPQKTPFLALKPASIQHRLSNTDLFWTAMFLEIKIDLARLTRITSTQVQ
jgi:hypothetical protein